MWVDINERLPKSGGFKRCKINDGTECPIPYTRNMNGEWLWLTPGEMIVTHWWED